MLIDFVICSLLNGTPCAPPLRRTGRLIITSLGDSETPIPNDIYFDSIPTLSLARALHVQSDTQIAQVPSNMRRTFRASVRQDLAALLEQIAELQEPDATDELRLLAEAACASAPKEEPPDGLRAWAERLSTGIVAD